MADLRFEWDPTKARANSSKHGITFEEASTVFFDDYALFLPDPGHSEGENRFLLLGLSQRFRILTVSHCYRRSEGVIRIISARKADRAERRQYNLRLPR